MSKGNGHPYSWSAILNGFDEKQIDKCEFSTIPKYLRENRDKIGLGDNTKVTHIWTQDNRVTERIARATKIRNTCNDLNEMIDNVDGIMLARDDSENHLKYAEKFLKAGMPIYIDKPIATTVDMARNLFNMQVYNGQIYTCSALRYSKDFKIDKNIRDSIGKIKKIRGTSIKDWDKYAVHIIEPAYCLIRSTGNLINKALSIEDEKTLLELNYEEITMIFETTGQPTGEIQLEIIGEKGTITRRFSDTFSAFKKSLEMFVKAAKEKREIILEEEVINIVKTIELGKV